MNTTEKSIMYGEINQLRELLDSANTRKDELEALLENYRGTCDECGRENVLLEAHADSYNYEPELYHACWTDPEECARIVRGRAEAAASKRQEAARRGWETRRNTARRAT